MKRVFALLLPLLLAGYARAEMLPESGGRLLATGGVTQVEGAGGGGIVPWALITGYGTRDQASVTAFYTQVDPSDFNLHSAGIAVGFHDRVEISYAQQRLGLGTTIPRASIDQDIVGLKVKVLGDAVYDQDRWWPQLAVGAMYKHIDDFTIPKLLGARRNADTDWYVAATKVYLDAVFGRNLLVNVVGRATRANQLGLLGFGGDKNDHYQLMGEATVGVFLHDKVVLGYEYRQKPDNLGSFVENDFSDVFLAIFPSKRVSLTAAWANLGQIADKKQQRALYFSAQLAF